MTTSIGFNSFPKIPRYNSEVIITEKIDGTNAQIYINDTGDDLIAGSRSRWITQEDDNFGFARWVQDNKEELLKLGPGHHFGEWWGGKIQRGYGIKEKRFSLFNVGRWNEENKPACCHVVPVIDKCLFADLDITITDILMRLKEYGSYAVPGYMNPEGLIIFHVKSGHLYKLTLDGDKHKGEM